MPTPSLALADTLAAVATTIDHPADPRVADYVRMTDAELRRTSGSFLLEGRLVLERAVAAGVTLRSALVAAGRLAAVAPILEGIDVPVYVATQPVLDAIAGFPIHRGIVAAAERPAEPDPLDTIAGHATIAALEGVNDAENLGAIFRNAVAFGIGAVLLDPTSADPLYRRAVRVSLGHVLAVPFARLSAWPGPLESVTAAGFTVAALTPAGTTSVRDVADIERVCFLLGAEGSGLTRAALDAADLHVRIPMAAGVDSLNVATAAAIAFHHRMPG